METRASEVTSHVPFANVIWELYFINYPEDSVTDDTLMSLQNFPKLTILSINDSSQVTDPGLLHLKEIPLTKLDLSGSENITDKGLKWLPETITQLDLSRCIGITDKGMRRLNKRLFLTILDLGVCDITSDGLQFLLPTLIELSPGGCYATIEEEETI